ncbi:MAG: hypothetical protein HYZ63_00840 [Candidatus Andersenbacteria bacterium]|nr:hypothetical protein [Candidatus Andersenbacteria bacterium]
MNFIQKKIHHLRQQPEEVKLKAVSRFTIIAGIILVVAWAGIFLPLQLRLRKSNDNSPIIPAPLIKEVQPQASPSPTPIPRPTNNPAEPASIKLTPTSEDTATPAQGEARPNEVGRPKPSQTAPVEITP